MEFTACQVELEVRERVRFLGHPNWRRFRRSVDWFPAPRLKLTLYYFALIAPKTISRYMGALTPELKKIIGESSLATIASVSPEGTPCASPLSSLGVLDDDTLIWADVRSPRTLYNLEGNSRTEILILDPISRKAVRIAGTVSIFSVNGHAAALLPHLRERHADLERVKTLVTIKVFKAELVQAPIYDRGFSEEEIKALWQEHYAPAARKTLLDMPPPPDF